MLAEEEGVLVSTDWQDMFQKSLEDDGKSTATIRSYLQDVSGFSRWFEAQNREPFTPGQLNGVDLREWRRSSLEVEQVQPSTWNRRRASLRKLVDWAISAGYLPYDPMNGVDRADEVELAPRWLEKSDLTRLLRRCEINVFGARSESWSFIALRDQAMIYLMAFAGLRESEVANLNLSDIELRERSGKAVVRLGKGQKKRMVPLALEVRRTLRLWLDARGDAGSPALFISSKSGSRISARTIQRRVAEIGGQEGLSVTPHDLRHTCAKRALDEGAPLTVVSKLLGHARLDTTARYVQPGWGDLEKAVERI